MGLKPTGHGISPDAMGGHASKEWPQQALFNPEHPN